MIETRWVIERYAIERVVERPGDVAGSCVAGRSSAQADLERGAFVEADRAFHRALVAGTGNTILLALYDSLRDRQRRMAARQRARPSRNAAIAPSIRERGALARRDRRAATARARSERRAARAPATARCAALARAARRRRACGGPRRRRAERMNCSATRLAACSGAPGAPPP